MCPAARTLSIDGRTLHAVGEAEARPYLEAGERRLEAGEYADAERSFREAVAAAPDSVVAHSKLGVALAQQGQLDAAISEFSKAISIHPGYAPAYSNLGNAYRQKGMLDEATVAYERAVAIDPDYWVAHQNLGALYKQTGRLSEAVEHFKKATRLSARRPGKSAPGAPRRAGCLSALVAALALVLLLGVFF